jgi:VCBS repeat-containing protein
LDPKLGPLQDNGGPTWTHAVLPGSPAIDAGTNDIAPPTDQRGFARIFDGNRDGFPVIDIGAFEVVNNPPTAYDDSVATDEDTPLDILLPAEDPDGDPLAYTILTPPAHGTLIGSGPNVIYVPALDSNGPDSFSFKVNDGTVDSNIATVTITVNPVNDPPVAVDDSYNVDEDNTLVGSSVLANDDDAHGGAPSEDNLPLSVRLVDDVAHGTLTLNADGTFTYVPALNFNGTDSFSYQAVDALGGVSNTATVTITVNSVNDAPVAADDSYNVDEDNTLVGSSVLANDDDAHGGAPSEDNLPLSVQLVDDVAHGTLTLNTDGTFTYVPALNFNGTDSFTYQAVDTLGGVSETATVTIHVRPIIDALIDIKPGSFPNSINLGSKGVLPVAILSTQKGHNGQVDDLDATKIDPATILFGDSREGFGRVRAIRAAFEDVDRDGDLDLVLHFDMERIVAAHALDADSVDAVLSADFDDDGRVDLLGHDSVRIVPPQGGGKKK